MTTNPDTIPARSRACRKGPTRSAHTREFRAGSTGGLPMVNVPAGIHTMFDGAEKPRTR
jgi:hypothetical protein